MSIVRYRFWWQHTHPLKFVITKSYVKLLRIHGTSLMSDHIANYVNSETFRFHFVNLCTHIFTKRFINLCIKRLTVFIPQTIMRYNSRDGYNPNVFYFCLKAHLRPLLTSKTASKSLRKRTRNNTCINYTCAYAVCNDYKSSTHSFHIATNFLTRITCCIHNINKLHKISGSSTLLDDKVFMPWSTYTTYLIPRWNKNKTTHKLCTLAVYGIKVRLLVYTLFMFTVKYRVR